MPLMFKLWLTLQLILFIAWLIAKRDFRLGEDGYSWNAPKRKMVEDNQKLPFTQRKSTYFWWSVYSTVGFLIANLWLN